MSDTKLVFRDPTPPHAANAFVSPVDLRYGWQLLRPSSASFSVSRADINATNTPEVFGLGQMVTMERPDELHRWVGFVQTARKQKGDPIARFTASDHAGALYARARTQKAGATRTGVSGEIVRDVFRDADARAHPPLMTRLPATLGGPVQTYTPKGESVLAFLRRFGDANGYEWRVRPVDQAGVVELDWAEVIGPDHSSEVELAEGVAFNDASLTESLEGWISEAVYVGGGGTFADRTAVAVSDEMSSAERGLAKHRRIHQDASRKPRRASSPALRASRVVVEPSVASSSGLVEGASAAFRSVEYVRERLRLVLVEANVDVAKIEVGGRYKVRFADLDLGLGYERVIRAVAVEFGLDGKIDMVAETWDEWQ